MPRGGDNKKRIGRGPRERCRSVSLFFKRHLVAERSVADRESSIALRHGVALKRKGSVEDRESNIALCHGVGLKKKDRPRTERAVSLCATRWRLKKKKREREREIGRGPREQYRSVPRGGVKKEKKGKKQDDRSWTEREVYRYPSFRYK